jgi:hypothetical protein
MLHLAENVWSWRNPESLIELQAQLRQVAMLVGAEWGGAG